MIMKKQLLVPAKFATGKLLLALMLLSAIVFSTPSCGKYEEGPGMSLLTKKKRLSREWDAKEYVSASGVTTADTDSDYLTFEKDGTFKITSDGVTVSGTWEFTSDKEKIKTVVTILNQTSTNEITILRLTNKEFWTKDSDGEITKFEAK